MGKIWSGKKSEKQSVIGRDYNTFNNRREARTMLFMWKLRRPV